MSFTCTYTPPSIKIKPRPRLMPIQLPGPDVSKHELSELACGRKFSFKIVQPKVNDWLSVEVTDGRGKINTVEIFDALGSEKTCTCDQYFEEESKYCVHIAALEGIEKLGWAPNDAVVQSFRLALGREKIKVPFNTRLYKQGAMFWDSAQECQRIFGKIPVVTENWVAATRWRHTHGNKNNSQQTIPQTFSSVGLLRNNLNLFDYQEDVFNKLLNVKRGICAMTMGSGKTLVTIACFAQIKTTKPDAKVLVIAPKSLCKQWISEIDRAIGLKSTWIDSEAKIKNIANGSAEPYVTTYQYATRHIDEFKKIKFDVVVVDEIQFVKNNDTKTWKAIKNLQSEYFFGLSGTVIENRLDDLFSIMEIVDPTCLGPKWKFNYQFQNVLIHAKTKVIYTGVKNLDRLKEKLEKNVFFYNKLNLPHITHTRVETKMSAEQKVSHDQNYHEAKLLIAKSLNQPLSFGEKAMLQAFLLKTRQSAQTIELITKQQPSQTPEKMKELEKLLKTICFTNNEKVVIFSEWVEHLKIAERTAKGIGLSGVFFTGLETANQRNNNVQTFKNDPAIKIFFSSDAGGVGLDGLQLVANNVIHLELPWNPSRLDQRTGRVHRFLQTKQVAAYYLVTKDSIEEKIETLLDDKRETRNLTLEQFL